MRLNQQTEERKRRERKRRRRRRGSFLIFFKGSAVEGVEIEFTTRVLIVFDGGRKGDGSAQTFEEDLARRVTRKVEVEGAGG